MDDNLVGEWPEGEIGAALRERLARVLDPELDESIVDLGFVHNLRLDAGHAEIALGLPTAWCAVNFAYLMAAEVREALLAADGVRRVTVRLGDHCAAAEIEAAVNAGRPFAAAFAGEGGGSPEALRRLFLRKGFVVRQERLLRELRAARWSNEAICALRLGEAAYVEDAIRIGPGGSAAVLRRYLERRAELGFDAGPGAPLLVGLDGEAIAADRLERYYQAARTMRVALEANGLFCRALIGVGRGGAGGGATHANRGGQDVPI
jgi:metal-sulfur cluster biosynthetic enzyme